MSIPANIQEEKLKSLSDQAVGDSQLASTHTLTTALLSTLQTPSGSVGGDFSILSLILSEDEAEEVQQTQAKQTFNFEQLASNAHLGSDGVGAPNGTSTGGKNAIAESAMLENLLQGKAQESMATELQQEEEVLQDELVAAQKQEALIANLTQAWSDYNSTHSLQSFQALMNAIIHLYGANSSQGVLAEILLQQGTSAYNSEQSWEHESGWHHFWHGEPLSNPHYWNNFCNYANSMIGSILGLASSTPEMLTLGISNMNQMIQDRVKNLMLQIQFLQVLEQIVSGKGNAVVEMQALMNVMMQMGVAANEQSTERNELLNNFNMMATSEQEQKIDNALDKLHKSEHQSHGLFGWISDFFKSIGQIFKDIAHIASDVASGNFKAAGEELEKLTGVNKIMDALKEIFSGNIKEGFENLIAAVAVVAMLGPMGAMLLNTSFGKDLTNAVKLVEETVVAIVQSLGDLIAAGIDKAEGNQADVSKLLSKAGDVWKKVAENPALQAVMQLAMVAVIVAAALSGQFYLAAFMAVLFVLSTTGALNDLTNDLANAIAKDTGNSAVAKVIADAIVITVVTIASLGVGALGAAGDVAADEAADAAATAAKEAAENASEEAEQNLTDIAGQSIFEEGTTTAEETSEEASQSIRQRITSVLKAIGPKAGAALAGLGTSMLDTNFGFDLGAAIGGKDKKELEKILEIVMDVIATLAATIGGGAMMTGSSFASADEAISNGVSKIAPKLAASLENNSAALAELGFAMQRAGLVGTGVGAAEMGVSQYEQGVLKKELADFMANMNELDVTNSTLNQGMQNLVSQYKQLTQEQETINNNAYAAAGAGIDGDIRSLLGNV